MSVLMVRALAVRVSLCVGVFCALAHRAAAEGGVDLATAAAIDLAKTCGSGEPAERVTCIRREAKRYASAPRGGRPLGVFAQNVDGVVWLFVSDEEYATVVVRIEGTVWRRLELDAATAIPVGWHRLRGVTPCETKSQTPSFVLQYGTLARPNAQLVCVLRMVATMDSLIVGPQLLWGDSVVVEGNKWGGTVRVDGWDERGLSSVLRTTPSGAPHLRTRQEYRVWRGDVALVSQVVVRDAFAVCVDVAHRAFGLPQVSSASTDGIESSAAALRGLEPPLVVSRWPRHSAEADTFVVEGQGNSGSRSLAVRRPGPRRTRWRVSVAR